MEKLQIKRNDIYRIPIIDIYGNDNGDYLEFDLQDISLPFRCMKSLEEYEKIKKYAKNQEIVIMKRDPKVKGKYMSKNSEDILKLWEKCFKDMRKAIDLFLGEGACEKIFKDKNYINMYEDLNEALQPYLEEIGLTYEDTKKRITEKYSKKENDVI